MQTQASILILNDSNSWPLIKNLESHRCIIDAHEYSLEELSDRIYWNLLIKPLKIFASKFIINANTRFSVEENICSKWEKVTRQTITACDVYPKVNFSAKSAITT